MRYASKKVEHIIVRFIAVIAIILMGFTVIPTSVFAVSGLTVSMQTSATSGAHSDIYYTFQISFTKPEIEKIDIRAKIIFNDDGYTKIKPGTINIYCGYGTEKTKYRTSVDTNESSTYDATFSGLNKTDSDGKPIDYKVSCSVDGYKVNVSEDNTITLTPYVYDINVECLVEDSGLILYAEKYGTVKYDDSITVTAPTVDTAYELVSESSITLDNVKENKKVTFTYRLKPVTPDPETGGGDTDGGRGNRKRPRVSSHSALTSNALLAVAGQNGIKSGQFVFLASNNEPYILAPEKQQEAGLTSSDGGSTYTFRKKAGESWSISGLRDDLSYTIKLTAVTLNGKTISLQTNYLTINGVKATSMTGVINGSTTLIFNYSPPPYQVRVYHKDIDTNIELANSETLNASQNGNLLINAKNDIKDYKPVAPESKSFSNLTANQSHTFYYQSTIVPVGEVKIVGQIIWEDYDKDLVKRPDSVDVELLQNGKVIDTRKIKIDKEDDYPFSFGNRPEKDSAGKVYEYTLRQQPATIAGYKKAVYDGTAGTSFIIKNTQKERNIIGSIFGGNNKDEDYLAPTPDTVPLPLGSLNSNENSAIFNVGVSAFCGATAMVLVLAYCVSIRSRRKTSAEKVQRNNTLRWLAVSLGVVIPVVLFALEDFEKQIGVFNSNSIFFIPLLFVFITAVIFFGISNRLFVPAELAQKNTLDRKFHNKTDKKPGDKIEISETLINQCETVSKMQDTVPLNKSVYHTDTYVTRTISSELEITNRRHKKDQDRMENDSKFKNTQTVELQKVVLSSSGVVGLTELDDANETVHEDILKSGGYVTSKAMNESAIDPLLYNNDRNVSKSTISKPNTIKIVEKESVAEKLNEIPNHESRPLTAVNADEILYGNALDKEDWFVD